MFYSKNLNFSVEQSKQKHYKKNKIHYVSYHKIFPAQVRYSKQNVAEKILKVLKKGLAKSYKKKCQFAYHHGKSLYPKSKAFPVVRAPFGYVLVDGHHHVMASIQLKAKKIPVKIIADLSHLSPAAFWQQAEENGWAHLYDINGQKVPPKKSFSELVDDPNRYFAAITALRYASNKNKSLSKKVRRPLWIKVDNDIPFIEYKIANALIKKGFLYDVEEMKDKPTHETIEKARSILWGANIEGLRLLAKPMAANDKFFSQSNYTMWDKNSAKQKTSKEHRQKLHISIAV